MGAVWTVWAFSLRGPGDHGVPRPHSTLEETVSQNLGELQLRPTQESEFPEAGPSVPRALSTTQLEAGGSLSHLCLIAFLPPTPHPQGRILKGVRAEHTSLSPEREGYGHSTAHHQRLDLDQSSTQHLRFRRWCYQTETPCGVTPNR